MAIEHGLKNMTLRQLWELFPIVLTPHQAQWKKWADEERGSLYRLLSGISPLTVTHIGSTAIEGINAKPIIDVQLSRGFMPSQSSTSLSKLLPIMIGRMSGLVWSRLDIYVCQHLSAE